MRWVNRTAMVVWLAAVAATAACTAHEDWVAECTAHAAHPDENATEAVAFDKINRTIALPACEKAVAGGATPELRFRLARALLAGNPTAQDAARAREQALLAFNAGYRLAGLALGYIYTNGVGVDKDEAKALQYDLAAAQAGSGAGKYAAGALMIANPATEATGLKLLEEATADFPDALVTIGDFHLARRADPARLVKAVDAYSRADAKGSLLGTYRLGLAHREGKSDTINPKTGFGYLLKAANASFVPAYSEMAKAYYFAYGVPRDYSKALAWANKGAEADDAYSRYFAGFMYFNGQGTAKNALRAETLLERSAAQGNESARKLLDSDVRSYAAQLRAMPETVAMRCVERRDSPFDENIIDYYNVCDTVLNVVVCKRFAADDIMSTIDGEDRERCDIRRVKPRSYVDNLYGASDNSAVLRKIIANTSIRIGACHPPLVPRMDAEKVYCEQR